jgi:hypothetical protein
MYATWTIPSLSLSPLARPVVESSAPTPWTHHPIVLQTAVYVIGAGFTKAFLTDAPLRIDEFDGEGLERLFAGFPVALRLIQLERRRNPGGKIDIERLMTRLDGGMPFDAGTAGDQIGLLLAELKQRFIRRIRTARDDKAVPELFVRFAWHCIEAGAAIGTFNHDDLLDEALWRVREDRK